MPDPIFIDPGVHLGVHGTDIPNTINAEIINIVDAIS